MKVYKSNCHVYRIYDINKPNDFAQAVLDRVVKFKIKDFKLKFNINQSIFPIKFYLQL